MSQYAFTIKTPFTNLGIRTKDDAVTAIEYVSEKLDIKPSTKFDKSVAQQVQRYCKKQQTELDVPIKLEGTPFQRRVWKALQKIPAGKVLTYGAIANKLSTSPRAVGNACRHNPVLLAVPCHRVVAANGIGGFSGKTEGKWPKIKRRLLAHEGVTID